MLKEKQGFRSQLCKWGAVAGVKEKEDCPVHSAQESLAHLHSRVQSNTPVPWDSTDLSVNRNFSTLWQCLEIETDTNLGRNTCFRSRFTLQGPKIHWGLKLPCINRLLFKAWTAFSKLRQTPSQKNLSFSSLSVLMTSLVIFDSLILCSCNHPRKRNLAMPFA